MRLSRQKQSEEPKKKNSIAALFRNISIVLAILIIVTLVAVIIILVSDSDITGSSQSSDRLLPLVIVLASIFVVYTVVDSIIIQRKVFHPLSRLTGSVSKAGADNDDIYGVERSDEFGELAQTIQGMRDRLNSYNAQFLDASSELERHDRLLYAVNSAAEVLLTADEDSFETSLSEGIRLMADCMDVDRVYIWQNEMIGEVLHYVQKFEWLNEDGKRGKTVGSQTGFSYIESMPDWEVKFKNAEYVNGSLKDLSEAEQRRLGPFGVKSILVIPVFMQESFWGFVSFDDCHQERTFYSDEVSILRSGSIMLANALQRNEMTQSISSAAARMKAVIANYSGVIWSVDVDNNITLFNGLYLKEMGLTPDFLEGKNLEVARKRGLHLDLIENVGKTLNSGPQEWVTDIGGKILRAHTTPIHNENGSVSGVMGSFEDITETFRLQKELEQAVENAQAASVAKGNFLSNMSHEMRTPMNAIIGMTTIGKTASDIEKKDYAFGKIEDASNHLLGVINDVLDMSKIEASKFELSEVEFNFEKLLQKVVSVICFRVDEKQQHFSVYLDKDIPTTLIGDDQRLAQVITNLLSNAVKFTPEEGTIRLTTRFVSEEDGVCVIQIEVSDTGIGISEEQQSRLFNSFEQAESNTSRKFGGTGLGLAISKHITGLMNGRIWVDSELGKGSTFYCSVELRCAEIQGNKLINSGVHWKNLRVLAVDDDHESLEYFASIADVFGIYCDTTDSGARAIDLIAERGHYDIYFIDWKMPEMDGIELSRRIKALDSDKSVIIMVSAFAWNEMRDEAVAAGVDEFLTKPLFPSDIADCINNCIGIDTSVSDEALPGHDVSFEGCRVLLAEDVEVNREIVIALLEPTQVEIDCAENGIEAIEMFTDTPGRYDMIFMDVQMPELDGLEATRRIRGLGTKEARSIPIIAMTANVFREDIEKCLSAGMNNHVGKPLDFVEVIDKMKLYLTSPEKENE